MGMKRGVLRASVILADIASRLPHNGFDAPRLDARLLLGLALGREGAVLPHEEIEAGAFGAARERLDALIVRRCRGEPISRMRGWREFYGHRFKITDAVLDPRADSEVLVAAVLAFLSESESGSGFKTPYILDLGTGSGCLLLSILASVPEARGLGIDSQASAIAVAVDNAASMRLSARADFRVDSWGADSWNSGLDSHTEMALEAGFDVIISNPPYIPTETLAELMPEVRDYDPRVALDGGGDGLESWRALAPVFKRCLKPEGAVFVEIGAGQAEAVTGLCAAAGLDKVGGFYDFSGILRCLCYRHFNEKANILK